MRVATLMTFPSQSRGRGQFLQQGISTEAVSNSYFKIPLAMYRMHRGKGGRVYVIDVIGCQVLWTFENSRGDSGMIRFTKKIRKGDKWGFMVRGKFLEF